MEWEHKEQAEDGPLTGQGFQMGHAEGKHLQS